MLELNEPSKVDLAENNMFVLPSIEENQTLSIYGYLLENMILISDLVEE